MMKLPVILPVKLVYLATSKNSNLGHVIHGKPQASPENKGAESFFYKEEGGVGRGCYKQSSLESWELEVCGGFNQLTCESLTSLCWGSRIVTFLLDARYVSSSWVCDYE